MKKILTIIVFVVVLSVSTFAQGTDGQVDFVCNLTEKADVYELSVIFQDIDFVVFQMSLRYDTNKVVAYNLSQEMPAKTFDEFATYVRHDGLNKIGEALDAQNGHFVFCGFVLPGSKGNSIVGEDGIAHTGKDFLIYKFAFKSLDGSVPEFEIACDDGGVFTPNFPEGAVVVTGSQEESLDTVNISFVSQNDTKTKVFDPNLYVKRIMTKKQRLEDTIYMQSGNYAYAKDGALAVIDSEDKNIVPETVDGKLFVPIRCIAEHFGFSVSWDDATKSVELLSEAGEKTHFSVGCDVVKTDADEIFLSADTYIKNGRTFVPADDLSLILKNVKIHFENQNDVIVYTNSVWESDREAEKTALDSMRFVVSPFIKIFA